MRQLFRIQRLSFLRRFRFVLVKFFFLDLALFLIKRGEHIHNLTPRIIPAICAYSVRNTLLPAMTARRKIPRFQRVVAAHRVAVPLRMSHAYYHMCLY